MEAAEVEPSSGSSSSTAVSSLAFTKPDTTFAAANLISSTSVDLQLTVAESALMSEVGTKPVEIEELPPLQGDLRLIIQSAQPMVQPSNSEQSPSEEAVLGSAGIPEENIEDLEWQADKNYFESMHNLHITKREVT